MKVPCLSLSPSTVAHSVCTIRRPIAKLVASKLRWIGRVHRGDWLSQATTSHHADGKTQEPRLPSPLGGPHLLFAGSFILEFLQLGPELDAAVLMCATCVGGHGLAKRGKDHPQVPLLHLHLTHFESFIVETRAVSTSTAYDVLDTIRTVSTSHPYAAGRSALSPAVPSRTADGVPENPPWTPHTFWPLTDEGREYGASLPDGRNSDSTILIWGHPRTAAGSPTGKLTSDVPPDMDAAFFLALLASVDAFGSNRVAMAPAMAAQLMSFQTASASALIMAPKAWSLGPLRWMVPWLTQKTLVVEIIDKEVVKRE
ncbi:hypothetical protein BDW68DRAFT_197397 [Aspergillus falconensis]